MHFLVAICLAVSTLMTGIEGQGHRSNTKNRVCMDIPVVFKLALRSKVKVHVKSQDRVQRSMSNISSVAVNIRVSACKVQ